MPHFLHRRGLLPPEYYSLRAEIYLHPLKGLWQFNLSKKKQTWNALNPGLECPRHSSSVFKWPLKEPSWHHGAQRLLLLSSVRHTAQMPRGLIPPGTGTCNLWILSWFMCMAGFQLPCPSVLRGLLPRQEYSFQALWEHYSHKLWCLSSLGAPKVRLQLKEVFRMAALGAWIPSAIWFFNWVQILNTSANIALSNKNPITHDWKKFYTKAHVYYKAHAPPYGLSGTSVCA